MRLCRASISLHRDRRGHAADNHLSTPARHQSMIRYKLTRPTTGHCIRAALDSEDSQLSVPRLPGDRLPLRKTGANISARNEALHEADEHKGRTGKMAEFWLKLGVDEKGNAGSDLNPNSDS
jgi:hypothetical protein